MYDTCRCGGVRCLQMLLELGVMDVRWVAIPARPAEWATYDY